MKNKIKHLFFNSDINIHTETITDNEAAHCLKTLRLKKGDHIHITDGRGNLYLAIITETTKKDLHIKIQERSLKEKEYNKNLNLAVSLLKNPSKLDFIVEKATEIGVNKINLLICARTEAKSVKMDRLNKIAISAIKQSQQYYLPEIQTPLTIKEFIAKHKEKEILIAHCINTNNKIDLSNISPSYDTTIMIGPEGDFTPEELDIVLQNKKSKEVSLGKTRLRTETAAIVATYTLLNKN